MLTYNVEVFYSAGKSPVFRDCSKILCETGASPRARFWSILPGIQSRLEVLLASILSRSLKSPNSIIFKSLIEGKVTLGNSGISDAVFLENIYRVQYIFIEIQEIYTIIQWL